MFVNSKIIRNRKLLEKDGIHNIAWFSSIMSVIQYKQQLWYFHLCHNTVPKKHSCNLYELGGLLQSLSKKSQEMYTPTQGLSVDESNAKRWKWVPREREVSTYLLEREVRCVCSFYYSWLSNRKGFLTWQRRAYYQGRFVNTIHTRMG